MANVVADALSRKEKSMGSLALIPVGERPLAMDVQALANKFVRLDISEPSRWDQFLRLAEFAYNNSYQSSIQMAPCEALYGRRCRSPFGWFEPGEAMLLGTYLVLLRVLPMKEVMRFWKKVKLSPRYIGPFEVLERVAEVAYILALPPILSGFYLMFHVSMLPKYQKDQSHVLDFSSVQLDENLAYDEEPMAILDRLIWKLRLKTLH
ncbi:uncharacterized protein [Nicotiana tomentosiformis]|uniref:uncharacterized protein n=1 Tax=Nicotiana tomentosiformis TaxID=4098 RepID=UPI00388CB689